MKKNKENIWIAIAHRAGMRIYNYEANHDRKILTLVHAKGNPEGSLKDMELGSDRPGRSFDSIGGGRHSLSTSQSPSEQVSIRFAKEICALLHEANKKHQFSKLILIAGPSFLGLLRQNLDSLTSIQVVHTLNKDLINLNDYEMQEYLEKNIDGFLTPES
jgi:protein required for attachment to host cells